MKIAMLTTVHRHDDIRIYQKEARTLAAAGHTVYVVNPEYDGEDENGIRFVKIPAPKRRAGRILFGWRAAARAAKELGAGCCHLHDPELLFAVPELRRAGMRVVYDAHEDLPRQILAKRWIWRPFRKAVSALAERAEDHFAARADAVIGAHPHVLQGIEYYQGKPIFYSLGNFIFSNGTYESMLVSLTLGEDGTGIRLIPCVSEANQMRLLEESKTESFYRNLESISFGISIGTDGTLSG